MTDRASGRGDAGAADKAPRWERARLYGAATLLGVAALAVAYQFVDPAPPSTLRLATGGPQGAYHAFGRRYRDVLARYGIELELLNSSGSIENLRLLADDGSGVQVAFVQGGTAPDGAADDLISLASLYYEPAWLFHRGSIRLDALRDLAGRRVAVGSEGSGARALALAVLRENGIRPDELTLLPLGGEAALAALQAGEIDAWFTVAGVRSALVRRAAAAPGVALYSFERAPAHARRQRYLSALVLPRGTLDLAADIPPRDVSLISPTAALVARRDLHRALEYVLLEAATEIHAPGGVLEEPGEFPSARFVDVPLADAARRYLKSGPPFLRRILPFWAATAVDRLAVLLLPLLAFALPLFRLMPALYNWRVRSSIYRWYKELRPLERHVTAGLSPADAESALRRLDRIKGELSQLSVPWAYADELYQLRLHVDLLRAEIVRAGGGEDETAGSA